MEELSSVSEISVLKESECSALIEGLRAYSIKNSVFEKFFNPHSISDDFCKKTTGLKLSRFLEVLGHLTTMNEIKNRNKSQALAIYLFWLKTGLPQETIAA